MHVGIRVILVFFASRGTVSILSPLRVPPPWKSGEIVSLLPPHTPKAHFLCDFLGSWRPTSASARHQPRIPILPSLYPSSPSSRRGDNSGTPGVDAEESVQWSFTTYIFLMSPSSKLSMFTVRESATSPVHRMNHSARLCAVPTRRQIRPRTRRRPPQSCLCRERGTPAMQSALSSETFPLSASARQCITMRQVYLRVTCPGPDTLASKHPFWTGLVGSTASSCIPSSGHANPDGLMDGAHQRTTWRTLLFVCLAAAQCNLLFGSS